MVEGNYKRTHPWFFFSSKFQILRGKYYFKIKYLIEKVFKHKIR